MSLPGPVIVGEDDDAPAEYTLRETSTKFLNLLIEHHGPGQRYDIPAHLLRRGYGNGGQVSSRYQPYGVRSRKAAAQA
jgi:hypothetical protein